MPTSSLPSVLLALAPQPAATGEAGATEYPIGEPMAKDGLQIVANDLVGIEMRLMHKGVAMGAEGVHIEVEREDGAYRKYTGGGRFAQIPERLSQLLVRFVRLIAPKRTNWPDQRPFRA